jgi:hypothetical protein
MPKIGVAVPTRNRADLLRESLICLRDQTSSCFEVIVLDNASTDETPQAFKDIVGGDQRFKFHRHDAMLPVMDNFLFGLNILKTEYFMWRADDDLSSKNFIEQLENCLNEDPRVDLAITPVECWNTIKNRRKIIDLPHFPDPDPIDRAIHLLRHKRPTWIYGLWRREVLISNISLIGDRYPYLWASDHMQMMPTVLSGRVAIAQDALFIQRILGRGSYELSPSERLKARAAYSKMCSELMREVNVPAARLADFRAALEFHIEDRVGSLKWLRRKAFKDRVLLGLGLNKS